MVHFVLCVEGVDGVDFNGMIHFRELPMEYECDFRKQIWSLKNLGKPLPNSAEAKRHTQKLKQAEKEVAECKETFVHGEEKSCQSGEERGR